MLNETRPTQSKYTIRRYNVYYIKHYYCIIKYILYIDTCTLTCKVQTMTIRGLFTSDNDQNYHQIIISIIILIRQKVNFEVKKVKKEIKCIF